MISHHAPLPVMAGLVPAIHEFFVRQGQRTWMPGPSPGMTALAAGLETANDRGEIVQAAASRLWKMTGEV